MTTKEATPLTDAATIDNSEFTDWGIGPSPYVLAKDMAELERQLTAARRELADARDKALKDAANVIAGFGNNELARHFTKAILDLKGSK